MRKTSFLVLAISGLLTCQSFGKWSDIDDCNIEPKNPTTSDTICITMWGVWPSSGAPRHSTITVKNRSIYFDMDNKPTNTSLFNWPPAAYADFCIVTPWKLKETTEPLEPGQYTVYGRILDSYSKSSKPYRLMKTFEVTDKQFVLSAESLVVSERKTAELKVSLLNKPTKDVTATVAYLSGDRTLVIKSGTSLTFTSSNYSTPQTVVVGADPDSDYLNGQALIVIGADDYLTAQCTLIENDNDGPEVLYVDSRVNSYYQNPDWLKAIADLEKARLPQNHWSGSDVSKYAQGFGVSDPVSKPNASELLKKTLRYGHRGTSWKQAFVNLQDAITVAAYVPAVKEIRVAEGKYTPVDNFGSRITAFEILSGITLKGGYAGLGASEPDARDIRKYETILTGDLHGNDGPDFENWQDNSATIVKITQLQTDTVLDGFLITGAEETAIRILGGKPTISNCIFRYNRKSAVGCSISKPQLTNCLFLENVKGTAVRALSQCELTLNNCVFWENGDSTETNESAQIQGKKVTLNNCYIQGWTGELGGTGNSDIDPSIIDESKPYLGLLDLLN